MPSLPPFGVIELAVEAKSLADSDRLGVALSMLAAADPSFTYFTDQESGQIRLRGGSEAQLEGKLDALLNGHGVNLNVGALQVAYRETITRPATIRYVHKRLREDAGEFALVEIAFEPGQPGSGVVFVGLIGENPMAFWLGTLMGLEAASNAGLVAGFPLIDFKATLAHLAYHDLDSSAQSFEIAARGAFRELRDRGAPILLEPVMAVAVTTPDACMGDVVGDLSSRRGRIEGVAAEGDFQTVRAFVPLSNMFGYDNTLRAFSQGRASFTMAYECYEPVPLPHGSDPDFSPAIGMRA